MTKVRSHCWPALGPIVLLAGFSECWFSETVADPDVWGHIRFGQDILRTGVPIQTDTYSYRTSGQPWINHEWLSELIFAAIYDRSGPPGLVAFKVIVSLLIVGLSYRHLRRRGLGPWSSVLLILLISVPFQMGFGTIRPQIFTYALFFAELLLLERAEAGHEAGLWAMPILFVAWVNLHGGVLAGVGVLYLWMLVRAGTIRRNRNGPSGRYLVDLGRLGLVGMACSLALLVNPYGAELVRFLLRTATVPRPEITEWRPLDLTSLPGILYVAIATIGVIALIRTRRPRKPAPLLILGLTAVLPLLANRHYPLFSLAMVVLGGEHIADTWMRRRAQESSASSARGWSLALCLVVASILVGLSLPRFGCIRIKRHYFAYPARAVALLKRGHFRGNMAVPFDWGEYAIWHLGPGVKVSIDGRRETVYSDRSYDQSRHRRSSLPRAGQLR